VRKSSIVWFLETKVQHLSNDRKIRVTQNSSLSVDGSLSIRIQQVQRRQLLTGDWVVFKTTEKRKTTVLIGRVISFPNLADTKKIVVDWNRETSQDDTGVLCVWYTLEKTGRKFNGNLLETAVHHHGYHPCFNNYVCTVPAPVFHTKPNGPRIYLPDKIIFEMSDFLKN
jgi:hypothetical protein